LLPQERNHGARNPTKNKNKGGSSVFYTSFPLTGTAGEVTCTTDRRPIRIIFSQRVGRRKAISNNHKIERSLAGNGTVGKWETNRRGGGKGFVTKDETISLKVSPQHQKGMPSVVLFSPTGKRKK